MEADDIFALILLLAMLAGIAWASSAMEREIGAKAGKLPPPPKKCPPHSWAYELQDSGAMYCRDCQFRAGQDHKPRGT